MRIPSANIVPRYNLYKRLRLVEGKRRYIEYYYRIPDQLAERYGHKIWQRFRVIHELNKDKSAEYSAHLLESVQHALDTRQIDPFAQELAVQTARKEKPTKWSLDYGLDHFLSYAKDKSLRKKTMESYKSAAEGLRTYFKTRLYQPLENITTDDIEEYLRYVKNSQKVNNTTRNKYLAFVITIFNHFVKKKVIKENPGVGVERLQAVATKHRYYDDKTLAKVKALLKATNTQLHNFCEFIYYTGTRPESEARLLKVKHILFDRGLIFIPGDISKNKKDDYIPMAPGLIDLLKEMGIEEAEPDHYLFSKSKKPGKVLASPKQFQKPFLEMRRGAGIDDEYTIYSFKHTRAIHLAQDGTDPYEIMKLFRHSGLDMTMKYLRDLGISDNTTLNKKSRKF